MTLCQARAPATSSYKSPSQVPTDWVALLLYRPQYKMFQGMSTGLLLSFVVLSLAANYCAIAGNFEMEMDNGEG